MKKWRIGLLLLWLAASLGALKVVYDLPLVTPAIPTVSARQQRRNQAQAAAGKAAKVTNVKLTDLTAAQAQLPTLIKSQMVGTLSLPSVAVTLPIMKAPTNAALMVGAAQYFPRRPMGEGNYVLASHNMIGADLLLTRISRLKRAALIVVSDGHTGWQYRVTRNVLVDQSQVDVVAQTKTPTVTLMRCEGPHGTRVRRIVQGRLVKVSTTQVKVTTKRSPYQAALQAGGRWAWLRQASHLLSEWLAGKRLGSAALAAVGWLLITLAIARGSRGRKQA